MTVSLSTFTRSPSRVLSMLDAGEVILTRRNGPSLLLSVLSPEPVAELPPAGGTGSGDQPDSGPASHGESARAELDALLTVLLGMVTGRQLLAALMSCCPWMSDLPPAARRSVLGAVSEPTDVEEATGAQHAAATLTQWRQRAEVFQAGRPA